MPDPQRVTLVLLAAFLAGFLAWFVLFGPTPDYLPPYGSDPRDIPYQMKD